MRTLYLKDYPDKLDQVLNSYLSDHAHSLKGEYLWDLIWCLSIYDNISDSKWQLLKLAMSEYTVDENRVRDWHGY